MSKAKFVGYFKLIEACAEPGCPACRCVIRESRSYLDAVLYEQVTDPKTRRALRASWGFCNWHTWMLLELEHAIFGAAIVYEDLVKLALERTERNRQPYTAAEAASYTRAFETLAGARHVFGNDVRAPLSS